MLELFISLLRLWFFEEIVVGDIRDVIHGKQSKTVLVAVAVAGVLVVAVFPDSGLFL